MSAVWTRHLAEIRRVIALGAAAALIASALIALYSLPVRAAETTVFVSPTGSDSNSGLDANDPVQTIPRAQQLVRSMDSDMSSDITVQLAGGVYRLVAPLTLTAADSGTNGYTITWTSAPGQTAVVSGADEISGWQPAGKGIWKAQVPRGLKTRQIYVNGARAYMAAGLPPVSLKTTSTGYTASSSAMSSWKNPTEIEFVYPGSLGYMVEPICPVASIKGKTITMAQPCWDNSNKRGHGNIVGYPGSSLGLPAYIQGALPLLTKLGQFYLDESANELYYMPRAGQNMMTADVEAPVLQALVQSATTSSTPVQNVAFNNIQFSYATWLQPDTGSGFSEEQAGYFITGQKAYASEGLCTTVSPEGSCPFGNWDKEPGAVQIGNDRNISFLNDQFTHLGAAGLNLDDGSQNDMVQGSVFTDISGNGVELGNVDHPQATGNDATSGITVSDNYLYGFPVEFHGGVPIVAGYVSNTTVAHNDIHDIPWAAISMGWGGWPDKVGKSPVANNMTGNAISDNLIYNFMEGLKDGGGVYTQGIQGPNLADGLMVSGNVVYNQLDWGGALKSDNGTQDVTYTDNVLYNNFYDWSYDVNGSLSGTTMRLENNYWQQGDPPAGKYPSVTTTGNSLISGASAAPSSILSSAGLESAYHSLASYHLEGSAPPAAPQMVAALYAFKGKAYLTWHPSYDSGSAPVSSYSVSACKATAVGTCVSSLSRVGSVAAGAFDATGYMKAGGFKAGKTYAVTVTAINADGSSVPSVPAIVMPVSKTPKLPSAPSSLSAHSASGGLATLIWNHPSSTKGVQNLAVRASRRSASVDANGFVLGYQITAGGKKIKDMSHIVLVETNTNGRVVYVLSGLTGGKSYKVTVAAIGPTGVGKPASVSFVAK